MQEMEYDTLTGLPNQIQLAKVLDRGISRAKRLNQMLALLYLDLNDFETLNETHGTETGDEILKQLAITLQNNLRKEEYVARVGGDEFIIVVEDIKDIAEVDSIAQKIQELMKDPIAANGKKIPIEFCMGIAMYPFAGDTAELLLKHADMALYMTKASGKGNFRYFTPKLNTTSERHLQIAAALQTALKDQEFYLSYSPIVDLHTNKIVAVEARLNWCSNELSEIPVSEFIPVAKDLGIMAAISHWELTKACRTFAAWELEGFHLYITITAQQFENEEFVHELQSLTNRLQLRPHLIVLKINENLISDLEDHHQPKLEEITKLGFCIAVDSYGKGASSLSQLKHFGIDSLKIDDSFIEKIGEDKEAESIIEAAIKMAHCLDLKAVADGVKAETQLSLLKHFGCDLAQGPYFSEPVDADEFPKLVHRAS